MGKLPDALDLTKVLVYATRDQLQFGAEEDTSVAYATQLAQAWPELPAATQNVLRRILTRRLRGFDEAQAEALEKHRQGYPLISRFTMGGREERAAWGMIEAAWLAQEGGVANE